MREIIQKLRICPLLLIVTALLLSSFMMTASAGGDEASISVDVPYEMWIDSNGETVVFSPEYDGWYEFYTIGDVDTYATLYNSNWEEIDYSDDTSDDTNFYIKEKLYSGYTYYLDVNGYFDSESVIFTLMTKETLGVDEAFITKEPDVDTVVKGFETETYSLKGLEVEFTLSDDTTIDWSYNNDCLVAGERVIISLEDDGTGHYYIDILCGDAFERFFYTTIENTVTSIEYEGSPLEYYENTNGFPYNENFYYNYALPYDAKLIVKHSDNTSETLDLNNLTIIGQAFVEDTQETNPWLVGNNNSITVSYLNKKTTIPVTILECPFESITVNSVPTRDYFLGDAEYGYMIEGMYILTPTDLSGLSFTAKLKDGTDKVYTDADIDMYNSEIDGYSYEVLEIEALSCETYKATISYKGFEITYDINVIESPLSDIEIVGDAEKREYDSSYYPILDGMKIKLTYKDGTSVTETVSKDNTEYVRTSSDFKYAVTVGDDIVYVYYAYGEENGEYYVLRCLGVEEEYYGFSFENLEKVTEINIDNISPNLNDTVVGLTYEDGSEETITINPLLGGYDKIRGTWDYTLTPNGITYYSAEPRVTKDSIFSFNLYILGKELCVDSSNGIEYSIIKSPALSKKLFNVYISKPGTYSVIFANYEDGTFVGMEEKIVTVIGSSVVDIKTALGLGKDDKIMLWRNLDSVSPLCESQEIK